MRSYIRIVSPLEPVEKIKISIFLWHGEDRLRPENSLAVGFD